MYASYHEINDNGIYEIEELYCFLRFSDVVKLVPASDGYALAEPDGSHRYRMVGYLTEVLPDDGCCELTLVVCHEDLPLPSYEEVEALI